MLFINMLKFWAVIVSDVMFWVVLGVVKLTGTLIKEDILFTLDLYNPPQISSAYKMEEFEGNVKIADELFFV